jgi:hypothetical protein
MNPALLLETLDERIEACRIPRAQTYAKQR